MTDIMPDEVPRHNDITQHGLVSHATQMAAIGLDLREEQAAMIREARHIEQPEGPYPCRES